MSLDACVVTLDGEADRDRVGLAERGMLHLRRGKDKSAGTIGMRRRTPRRGAVILSKGFR